MDQLGDFVAYDHLAVPPLNELGWQVEEVSWHSTIVDWNRFAAVVIRTPWDYHHHLEKFLSVIDQIEASSALLCNSAQTVRWNIDKQYLRELESLGLPIVPTICCARPPPMKLRNRFRRLLVMKSSSNQRWVQERGIRFGSSEKIQRMSWRDSINNALRWCSRSAQHCGTRGMVAVLFWWSL